MLEPCQANFANKLADAIQNNVIKNADMLITMRSHRQRFQNLLTRFHTGTSPGASRTGGVSQSTCLLPAKEGPLEWFVMNKRWLWLAVCAGLFAVTAQAQLEVGVRLDQEQFLPTEMIEVSVRVTNRTGQTLWLGEDPEWLTFSVQGNDGRLVSKNGEAPVEGKFMLEASKVAVKRVNIAPYFELGRPGRYHIAATVTIRPWNMTVSSAPKGFDIVEGTKLWTQDVGVPPRPGAPSTQPEVRRYMLQQANYLRTQVRLYLRITDTSGLHTFRVVPIGNLLSFSRPEGQVDAMSNLHVLYQNGPRTFSYSVFNPNGDLLLRQMYDFGESRPRLSAGRDSRISVQGGVRRTDSSDIPPPDEKELSAPHLEGLRSTNTPSATQPSPGER